MTKYILTQDSLAYDPDVMGGAPSILAFRKGDRVESDKIIDNYMWMSYKPLTTPIKGIVVKPTVPNPKIKTEVFIPLTSLQEEKTTSTTTNQPNQTKNILKFALLGLIIYFLVKK
jgi:Na+-translocating ferredoxin:NAD+ oxidoreductase RnfC subunit